MRPRIGPEGVGAILSAVVLSALAGLAVVTFGGTTTSPTGSSAPEAPSPPDPSPPTSSPSMTVQKPTGAVLSWSSDAQALLEVDEQLLEIREDIRSVLGDDAARTTALVQLMRNANQLLQTAVTQADALQEAGLEPALADAVGDVHDDALAIAADTLRASIQNAAAYREGAARLEEALAPLETIMAQLADASTLPMPSLPAAPGMSPAPSP